MLHAGREGLGTRLSLHGKEAAIDSCLVKVVNELCTAVLSYITTIAHTQLYEGVKRATGYVSPAELASCDIVLVTYETLRTEFYHATSQEVSWNLRHRKRYVCYPSPLPAVHWWRVSKT